jgi:hypothetical protein
VKNIQIIDGADNCAYDVFAATEDEFALIFLQGTDIAFIDEVMQRADGHAIDQAFEAIWARRVPKPDVQGIHGTLFYELQSKKQYYPTRRDEDAVNPDGSRLR